MPDDRTAYGLAIDPQGSGSAQVTSMVEMNHITGSDLEPDWERHLNVQGPSAPPPTPLKDVPKTATQGQKLKPVEGNGRDVE